MKISIKTNTNGKGEHTEDARMVEINRLGIGFSSLTYFPDDPFNGTLRAYFEPSGYTEGSWNVEAYGHICGDKLWLREFKKGLRELGLSILAVRDLSYSDNTIQGNDHVSLDIGPTFYKSWTRLTNKLAKDNS